MDNALPSFRIGSLAHWRELVLPKEHGSWSLALEPLAFGLIAAPSFAGAGLAVAVTAAFFARRPLRIAWRETRAQRRSDACVALAGCGFVAVLCLAGAILLVGGTWLGWLVPSAIAGAIFLSFDLRNGGREEPAEIAGSAAFALLPAALAVLAGESSAMAMALALVMCGRAVPTVLTVRAALRGAKTGMRRPVPAVIAVSVALAVGIVLARSGLAPTAAMVALGVLAVRTIVILVFPRPVLHARTIGMIEAALGLAFVIAVATAWHG
jgi:hypothetical protein